MLHVICQSTSRNYLHYLFFIFVIPVSLLLEQRCYPIERGGNTTSMRTTTFPRFLDECILGKAITDGATRRPGIHSGC